MMVLFFVIVISCQLRCMLAETSCKPTLISQSTPKIQVCSNTDKDVGTSDEVSISWWCKSQTAAHGYTTYYKRKWTWNAGSLSNDQRGQWVEADTYSSDGGNYAYCHGHNDDLGFYSVKIYGSNKLCIDAIELNGNQFSNFCDDVTGLNCNTWGDDRGTCEHWGTATLKEKGKLWIAKGKSNYCKEIWFVAWPGISTSEMAVCEQLNCGSACWTAGEENAKMLLNVGDDYMADKDIMSIQTQINWLQKEYFIMMVMIIFLSFTVCICFMLVLRKKNNTSDGYSRVNVDVLSSDDDAQKI